MSSDVVAYVNPVHTLDVEAADNTVLDQGQADELEWDDDMLQDLVFAFEACDIDGSGYLGVDELLVVMRVLGGVDPNSGGDVRELDVQTMKDLIEEETLAWHEFKKNSTRAAQLMKLNQKLLSNVASGEAKVEGVAAGVASGVASGVTSGLNLVHAGGLVKGGKVLGQGVSAAAQVSKGIGIGVVGTAAQVGKGVASTVGHVAHVPSLLGKDEVPDGMMS